MEEVAVVGWAQTKHERSKAGETDQDIIYKVVSDALLSCSMTIRDIDVVLDAGSDFLDGRGISNSMTLDAMGAHSKVESKVAGDGLLAAIYAYMRVASGMYSSALVVAYGKSSESSIRDQTRTFAEPFYLRPLGLDALAAGALRERAYLHPFRVDRDSVAAVAVKNRAAGAKNPNAQLRGEVTLEEVIASPDLVEPIRRLEACPATDGACAVVLADGPISRSLGVRPAWIKGVGHSQDTCSPVSRDLHRAGSARLAANIAYNMADVFDPMADLDVLEVSEFYAYQELILYKALGLCADGDGAALLGSGETRLGGRTPVNPSGSPRFALTRWWRPAGEARGGGCAGQQPRRRRPGRWS